MCQIIWSGFFVELLHRVHTSNGRLPGPRIRDACFLTTWAAETNLTWYYAIPWWLIVAPIYCNCAVPHMSQTTSGPFSHGYEHQTGLNTYHTRFLERSNKKPNKSEFCALWRYLHTQNCYCCQLASSWSWWQTYSILLWQQCWFRITPSFWDIHPFMAGQPTFPQGTPSPRNSRPYDQGLWQPLGSLNKADYQTRIFLGGGRFGGGLVD